MTLGSVCFTVDGFRVCLFLKLMVSYLFVLQLIILCVFVLQLIVLFLLVLQLMASCLFVLLLVAPRRSKHAIL